jgi:hypothetical protein
MFSLFSFLFLFQAVSAEVSDDSFVIVSPNKGARSFKSRYISAWSSLPYPVPGFSVGCRIKHQDRGDDFSVGLGYLYLDLPFSKNQKTNTVAEARYLALFYDKTGSYSGIGGSFQGVFVSPSDDSRGLPVCLAPKFVWGQDLSEGFMQLEFTPIQVFPGVAVNCFYPHGAVEVGCYF